eukprot:2624750-Rhodomonas_salina.1
MTHECWGSLMTSGGGSRVRMQKKTEPSRFYCSTALCAQHLLPPGAWLVSRRIDQHVLLSGGGER